MILEFNNVTKRYNKEGIVFTALDDVTLKAEKGDYIAVKGPSGSGKSTLLHTAGGLIHPDSGVVLFRGRNIYDMKKRDAGLYRQKSVGFVFQQFHLIPYLTVSENITTVCTGITDLRRIDSYLEQCALESLKNKYPSELSVGEKQRTAFVRAIITGPEILLADEPTGNLDPVNSQIIMSLVDDFHKNGGTVLLVSHSADTAKYADRIISLSSGKILQEMLL